MKSANSKIQSGERWSPKEQQVIDDFVIRVRETFKERAKRIILYGSRARGDAEEESDYDFLGCSSRFMMEIKENSETLDFKFSKSTLSS